MITREDLANKKIDKLENIEQAKEMINLLTYDECLAVLNGTKNIPNGNILSFDGSSKKRKQRYNIACPCTCRITEHFKLAETVRNDRLPGMTPRY